MSYNLLVTNVIIDEYTTCFIFTVYQETVLAGTGGHCTTLNCANGYNNLKAVNCFHTHAAGRCGKFTQTNVTNVIIRMNMRKLTLNDNLENLKMYSYFPSI